MSMLANITRGKIPQPALIIIYGPGGIGKTSFGARAPSPIFLGAEDGSSNLDVARFPTPKSYEEILMALSELLTVQHEFKTIVIDSLDWIEPLVHAAVLTNYKGKTMETAAGGYGKAYEEALQLWTQFRLAVTALRNKGMNVIMIAHPKHEKITNPITQTTYERYDLKLHKKVRPMFTEWVDALFFASFQMYTKKEGDVVKSFSTDQRVLNPVWKDGFDAKNRYGLQEPIDLGMPWNDFVNLCQLSPGYTGPTAAELRFRIGDHMKRIKDEKLVTKINDSLTNVGEDVNALTQLLVKIERL